MGMRGCVVQDGREYKLSGLIGQALIDCAVADPGLYPGVDVQFYSKYKQHLFTGGVQVIRKNEAAAVNQWFFGIVKLANELPKLGVKEVGYYDLLEHAKVYSFLAELCDWLRTEEEFRLDLHFS